MPGLILKLRPHEQLMINGVVVENGDRKTRLRVKSDGAKILRLRDAIKPEDATTPLKRAYYIAQMAVGGQLPSREAAALIDQAMARFQCAEATRNAIAERIADDDFYKVMRYLGALIGAGANVESDDDIGASSA